jgi:hypothetical protein
VVQVPPVCYDRGDSLVNLSFEVATMRLTQREPHRMRNSAACNAAIRERQPHFAMLDEFDP